ncbi:MAG: GNAT family N-acetyltransferase [Bacteroidales bacterium]|nr:GNAT family N-acetyltransferase [Bacteroidales bacterium]
MLTSKTINLRAPEPEDLDLFYRWENDTELWSYGSTIAPFSKYILKEYIANAGEDIYQTRQLRLMIVSNNDNDVVGMIDLFDFDPFHRRAAVGILIDGMYQKHGFGKGALEILCKYAFNFLGIHNLYAYIPVSNSASMKLFESVGFLKKGILTDWLRRDDKYEDVAFVQKIRKSK